MRAVWAIARREFAGYFATPVAAVFIVIFLVLAGALTFTLGGFSGRNQADLLPFFGFVPWLLLFLVPALTMRLWAEERRLGTIEMLLTLPIAPWHAVLGKWLAAWAFCAVALALTFPLVITVNWLGEPDNGAILAGYLGCVLVAGAYLALGAAVSAMTRNQVIAFVLGVAGCFVFAAAGSPIVADFLSARLPVLGEVARGFSVAEHFGSFVRGVIALPDLAFFAAFTGFWLFANAVVLEWRRGS
ncbi:ABC transporter permease subunit [Sabulicella glaciei]|uniref:ABC transporter permease subunit n=1 Tax=Sabulicella glaciei TaxID=2984948 RepID=A0ABT3NPH5_9PROT|nr:ABC transporter permease subunit [Roseococcus sp. MDT2-1-1]MCW8084067.1 ABC transporter permease subunit [Roseococcus sp. MDT2-1-1]